MLRRLVALSASCALLLARSAAADDDPNDPNVRADRLFRDAEKLFDSGDVPLACATWADSLRIQPKLGTLLNLALCHETMGRIATAWKEFHYGAAWAAQNGQKDRQKFAHEHASQLEPKLPRVSLQFTADRQYATIEIDGEPLPETEWVLPFYLDPGEHTIAVTAPGHLRKKIIVHVTAAPSSQVVPIGELEESPRVVPPPPGVRFERTWMSTAGMIVGGVGVATFATSLYFGFRAVDGRDELKSRCASNQCLATGIDAYRDAQADANVSTWLAVSGILLSGVGVGLVIFDPRRAVMDVAPKSAPKPRTAWSFRPERGGAGMSFGGQF